MNWKQNLCLQHSSNICIYSQQHLFNRQFPWCMHSPHLLRFAGQWNHIVAWNKKCNSLIVCKFTFRRFAELNRSSSSCSSSILIKYNVELFLLIDKIICMEKDNSLFLPENNYMSLKINYEVENSNRHVITHCDLCDLTIGKTMFLSYDSASLVKCDPQTDVH